MKKLCSRKIIPYVEPVADDLASIFLDIEMEEKGFTQRIKSIYFSSRRRIKI